MTRTMRMLWGRWWMLAVIPLAGACDEAPSAPGGASRDLEFVLPALKGTPATISQTAWMRPADEALPSRFALAVGGPEEPDDGGTPEEPGEFALIFSKYVTSSFESDEFSYEYGLSGFGTSYSMRPTYRIFRKDGSTVVTGNGAGREESLYQVPLMMRPSASERIRVGMTCGASGSATVSFTVRIDTDLRFSWHSQANDNASSGSSQVACTSTGGGGGGIPPQNGSVVEICYYEVWVDRYGNIVEMIPLGCYYVTQQT